MPETASSIKYKEALDSSDVSDTRRSYSMRKKRELPIPHCICGISIILIALGIVILVVGPSMLSDAIKNQLLLKPGTQTYDVWKENPFPLVLDIYLFNWTNPEDYFNSNWAKPRFRQLGPYRFVESKKKVNVTFNDNGTVTYMHQRSWQFDESEGHSLMDYVTTINPISLSASHTLRFNSSTIKTGLSASIMTLAPTIEVTKTVGQMLFEGYEDSLINFARTMGFEDSMPPMDKFGWFYMRNNSVEYDGIFNAGTGLNNDLGTLYNWNHLNQTEYYEGECRKFRGSSGELFPPKRSRDSIAFFSSDMCRSIVLDYTNDARVNGIEGYKYTLDKSFLDNGDRILENKCNCLGDCLPSGAINISTCRYGTPGFVSLPHFYKADPFYINSINGVEPNQENHEFYMILEPQTGIPLEVAARLQINLFSHPVDGVSMFADAPRIMFPMLWMEQKVKIPDNMAFQLKLMLNAEVIILSIGIISIALGAFLFSCVCYKLCTFKVCKREQDFKNPKELKPLNTRELGFEISR